MLRKLRSRAAAMKTISQLLREAEEIARRSGLARPAAEHLVLAALELPDGTARRVFERLGATGDDFGAALQAQETDDLGQIGIHAPDSRINAELPAPTAPTGVYRSEPSAEQLFQLAGDDARGEGGTLLGAHVLRAAAALEHGPTARAFGRMGIDPSELHEAATAEIDANHAA